MPLCWFNWSKIAITTAIAIITTIIATTMQMLQRIASLNTEATFLTPKEGKTLDPDVLKRDTKGDASESAIIKFVQPLRDVAEYRAVRVVYMHTI